MPDTTSNIFVVAANRKAGPILLGGFALSLFTAASLRFSTQPRVWRLMLPRLGGLPAVWNACVCFLEAALLVGHGYAHLGLMRLQPRAQIMLHMLVFASAMILVPLSLGLAAPPADPSPTGWLVTLLTLTVGLRFVANAATAPSTQTWFARSTHLQARIPNFFYTASNGGSLVALVGAPRHAGTPKSLL